MSDYAYCPICGCKIESWSGFWPDRVFQVRRASVSCEDCGFKGSVVVKTGDKNLPKVNLDRLRDNE